MARKHSQRGRRSKPPRSIRTGDPARLWQDAVNAYQQGNPARARRALEPLLEHPAADATTFLLAGVVAAQLEHTERAIDLLGKAVEMNPESTEAWLSLGNVLHARGRMEDAAAAFMEATSRSPGNAEAWNNLGVVQEDTGRTRDALDSYNRALEVDPGFVNALRRRAPVLEGCAGSSRPAMPTKTCCSGFPTTRCCGWISRSFWSRPTARTKPRHISRNPGTLAASPKKPESSTCEPNCSFEKATWTPRLPGLARRASGPARISCATAKD